MWRDKVVEKRVLLKVSNKYIADYAHVSEKTIIRLLSGETLFASVDLVLKVGEAVGLSAVELFNETNAIVGNDELLALQERLASAEIELAKVKSELGELTHSNELLKVQLDRCEKIIALQEDVISLQKSR